MLRGILAATALSLFMMTQGAIAADPPRPIGAQAQAMTKKHFPKIDKNGDRFITVEEWVGYGYKVAKFTIVDIDRNGRVTAKEFLMAQEFCDTCF